MDVMKGDQKVNIVANTSTVAKKISVEGYTEATGIQNDDLSLQDNSLNSTHIFQSRCASCILLITRLET